MQCISNPFSTIIPSAMTEPTVGVDEEQLVVVKGNWGRAYADPNSVLYAMRVSTTDPYEMKCLRFMVRFRLD